MFVAFNLRTQKNVINFDRVSEFTVHYGSTPDQIRMVIYTVNEQDPWCWTFVDKEALEKTYNDIILGLHEKEAFINIPEDRLA